MENQNKKEKTLKEKVHEIAFIALIALLFFIGITNCIYSTLGIVGEQAVKFKARTVSYIMGDVGNYGYMVNVPKAKAVEEKKLTPIEEMYHRFENDLEFRNYIANLKVRRNNPGNLKFKNQPGAVDNNGFAEFKTPLLGFRALVLQVELYQSRDLTIRGFLSKYAPHNDNDTEHLIRVMSESLSLSENTNIENINTIKLSQDIVRQEFSVKY